MKREFKSGCASIRAERRSVRLEIREAILDQRALHLEIEEQMRAEDEEMARIQEETALLTRDASATKINPDWRAQYEEEYWDWVDGMEEFFEREWDDDFDDVGERDRDQSCEEIA